MASNGDFGLVKLELLKLIADNVVMKEVFEEAVVKVIETELTKLIDREVADFLAQPGEVSMEDLEAQVARIFDKVDALSGHELLRAVRK
eukprot:8863325-Lingulodinium_polyedra.AAC.1